MIVVMNSSIRLRTCSCHPEEMKRFEHNITAGKPIPGNQVTQVKQRNGLQKQACFRIKKTSNKSRSVKAREKTQKTLAAAITYFTKQY